MDSFTITLNGTSSILSASYYPPIELHSSKKYVIGLVELLTFNSIPNIDIGNNTLYVDNKAVIIPTGSYEIDDIEKYLMSKNINIKITPNNNTLTCNIFCDKSIDFRPNNSIGKILGFTSRVLEANVNHESDLPVQILKVNAIRVECSIATGAFINEKQSQSVYQFAPMIPPGFKIVEVPSNVIYLPTTVRSIDYLELRLVDQNNELINFRGETITVRLHIKSL